MLYSWFQVLFYALAVSEMSTAVEVDAVTFSDTIFDYVIVGGGTTGLALASRLSDDPQVRVGVIEAGQHISDNKILIPGMIGSTLSDPKYDWMFFSEPQATLNGRTVELGRGKVLGGTSALNFMAHTRASSSEYDGWESLGNPTWNHDSIQTHIQRSEHWTPPDRISIQEFHANNDTGNHGLNGSVLTTSYTFYTDIVVPFFQAMNRLGSKTNNAANGGQTLGVWTITGTVDPKNRTRSYSTTAYYMPRFSRKNLLVTTQSQATKIILKSDPRDSSIMKAFGVEYVDVNGVMYSARSRREIILSCGAIQTPQLLELSGIGNSTYLEKIGITPIIDLPGVGENLQDHPGVTSTFRALDNLTTLDALSDPVFAETEFAQYVKNRTGMFSSTTSTIALLRLEDFVSEQTLQQMKKNLDRDLSSTRRDLMLQRSWLENSNIPQIEVILFPQFLSALGEVAVPGQKYYTLSLLFQHAWARGKVHINSTNGTAAPKIDPQYLVSPGNFDTDLFVEGLKFLQRVATTKPLKDITLEVIEPRETGDGQLRAYIQEALTTNYHFVGTAAMLPRAQNGVVDSDLKVYGTSNLRVVDASIFPIHIAAHPTASLYGLAEKAWDIIQNETR
ncbi:hypothetical protein VKT23_009568 [Stygiomarasmius scandens]|uniref:Glucose-methanol-choline oxidoreductase N-terminal domain-containing protein n=1 Tax=Marasmiellus scandens TaxID=2682957 RepID=A0ABR1JE58_9AGAR